MLRTTTAPLFPESLEANRAGVLSDDQQRSLTAFARATGTNTLAVAAFTVILGIVLLSARGPAPNAWLRPYAAVAAFAIAALMVLRRLGFFPTRFVRDVRAGRVEAVEGAIAKDRGIVAASTRSRTYYLLVGGRRFTTGYGTYDAAPDAGIVRLYYLPRSLRVVNLEPLPDQPLPAGALDSPAAFARTLAQELRTGGRAQAMATLAAMQSALIPGETPGANAPPPEARDPRPLAQAILGSWRGGMFSLAFSADGAVTVSLPMGRQLHGCWSVDPAGRLHTETRGEEQVGDAWIVGDTLNLVADGKTVAFQRV